MMGVLMMMESEAQALIETKIRRKSLLAGMHPVLPMHTTQASTVSLSYFCPKL